MGSTGGDGLLAPRDSRGEDSDALVNLLDRGLRGECIEKPQTGRPACCEYFGAGLLEPSWGEVVEMVS